MEEILGSDPPTTVEEVLDEAPILAIVVDPDQSDDILDRYDDYLDVALDNDDLETTNEISDSVVDGLW